MVIVEIKETGLRVLIINEFTRRSGGTDVVVRTQKKVLEEAGVEVEVLRFDNRDFDSSTFAGKALTLLKGHRGELLSGPLEKIVRDFDPKIIHIHNLYPLLANSFDGWLGNPGNNNVIMHLHNFFPVCLNSHCFLNGKNCTACLEDDSWRPGVIHKCYNGSSTQSFVAALVRTRPSGWFGNSSRIRKFVAVSQFLRNKYVEFGLDAKRIRVIPNAMAAAAKEQSEDSLGEYVLYIGAILREKGILTLLEVAKKVPKIKFKIAGDGIDMRMVKRAASGLSNVELVGFAEGDEKEELFRKCRFVVQPSECWETFGMVVLEANSHGKPVIASRLGGLEELITVSENGLFVNPADVDDLSAKVAFMWEHWDYDSSPSACRLHAARFSTERFRNELLKMYGEIAD